MADGNHHDVSYYQHEQNDLYNERTSHFKIKIIQQGKKSEPGQQFIITKPSDHDGNESTRSYDYNESDESVPYDELCSIMKDDNKLIARIMELCPPVEEGIVILDHIDLSKGGMEW